MGREYEALGEASFDDEEDSLPETTWRVTADGFGRVRLEIIDGADFVQARVELERCEARLLADVLLAASDR